MIEQRERTFQKGFYHSMGLIKPGPVHQRFANVAMSPKPRSFRSAVTKVSANTLAVAARNRSAGSAWLNCNPSAVTTTSCVKGASRNPSAICSTQ